MLAIMLARREIHVILIIYIKLICDPSETESEGEGVLYMKKIML